MKATIRPARTTDAEAIVRLTGQLGYDVDAAGVADRLARILRHAGQRFLVAEADSRVVGWMHATTVETVEAGAFVMIAGLVVDKTYRGGGIGRLLMEEAERWTREQGCAVVRLWSSAFRAEAHQFYERLGYANIKTQVSFAKALDAEREDALRAFVPRREG